MDYRLQCEVYHRELVKANRAVARLSKRNKQLRQQVQELNQKPGKLIHRRFFGLFSS